MATTIVNPPPTPNEPPGNGMGFLLGVIILIVFVVLLIFYGLPYLQKGISSSVPQINVPGKINVNVQQGK